MRVYIFFLLLGLTSAVWADEPKSSLDDKPSVDAAAAAVQSGPSSPADASTNSSSTTTASPLVDSQTQTSYIYDLKKLIEKSRDNIKRVNEKIKEEAVIKRNQQREERAREYYQKGMALKEEGKFDEAREYFEKAIRITEHPEMSGYIKDSERRLRKQEEALRHQESEQTHQVKQDAASRRQDAETAYNEAVAFYREKKFHPAKDAFDHVEELSPDYRATRSYLRILEQDIIQADSLALKQQKIEMSRQEKEAEAARAKEKEVWRKEIEEKEKQRKDQINKQADAVYNQAVDLYKKKKFTEAKQKFQEVEWVIPDYKATSNYLKHIDHDAQTEQDRVAKEQEKVLATQHWEEEVQKKKDAVLHAHDLQKKDGEQKKQLEEQAQFLYEAAVTLYDKNDLDQSLEKFTDIEKTSPNYKATRMYIARIKQKRSSSHVNKDGKQDVAQEAPTSAPAPVFKEKVSNNPAIMQKLTEPVSLKEQQAHTDEITALANKSSQLYHQIAELSGDQSINQVKNKLSKVDQILNNVKNQQERLLRQMRQQQSAEEQQHMKEQDAERRLQAETRYQEALGLLRTREFDKAKIKFLDLENFSPNYKDVRNYLAHIEDNKKEAEMDAVTEHERSEAKRLKEMESKQKESLLRRKAQEEELNRKKEEEQKAQIISLAAKASSLNDDIIALSQVQDYEAMKAKFTELENILVSLKTIKEAILQQKETLERQKMLAKESARDQRKDLARDAQAEQDAKDEASGQRKERRPKLPAQESNAEALKRQEVIHQQDALYAQAVDLYGHRKYVQAKILFGELAAEHDHRAAGWIQKIDRALGGEVLKSKVSEEKERTGFIAEQLRVQRKAAIVGDQERQRQKKLTEELERQKRLWEDQQQRERDHVEALKMQDRERRRIEQERLKAEKQRQQKEDELKFRKVKKHVVSAPAKVEGPRAASLIPAVDIPPVEVVVAPVPTPAPTPAPVVEPVATPEPVVTPVPAPVATPVPALTEKQKQAQIKLAEKRKSFFDKEYKKQQVQQAKEAKLKAQKDAEEKRVQEKKHQEELKVAQAKAKEEHLLAEKKHQEELKAQEAERRVAEKKHAEELKIQQEEDRKEHIKQAEIARADAQKRLELERQANQRQMELKIKHDAMRKELEAGVEEMYQNAQHLYKSGQYSAAADKFQDVEDVIPHYKRAQQLILDARQKAVEDRTAVHDVPITQKLSKTPASQPEVDSTPSTTGSRQNAVSKALDLFDPNVK